MTGGFCWNHCVGDPKIPVTAPTIPSTAEPEGLVTACQTSDATCSTPCTRLLNQPPPAIASSSSIESSWFANSSFMDISFLLVDGADHSATACTMRQRSRGRRDNNHVVVISRVSVAGVLDDRAQKFRARLL